MKQHGNRYCSTCKHKLQKRGRTAAGAQRWLCVVCNKSATKPRQDLRRALLLERFVAWLLSKNSQTELAISYSDRTWRAKTLWCWDVVPAAPPTGEIHQVLLLDGVYIGDQVCLVARTTDYVVAWHWAPHESTAYWGELLARLPPPQFVVSDGQKGILGAVAQHWPEAHLQRCMFHAWLHIFAKLRGRGRSEAAKALLVVVRGMFGVHTFAQRDAWLAQLAAWEVAYGDQVKATTRYQSTVANKRGWRYSDPKLKAAHFHLTKLLRNHQLFTYIEHLEADIPRTTNHVEGGINSQLRTKLKLHRGMPAAHQQRLVEWYLYSRAEEPKPPRYFL